jgi:hypothetical protein
MSCNTVSLLKVGTDVGLAVGAVVGLTVGVLLGRDVRRTPSGKGEDVLG